MSFFTELKRRNVVRVAVAYLVIGWVLMQLAALLEAALTLPPWFDTVVVSFLVLGLPVALFLSWAYEMTPDGVKKTEEVDAATSIAHTTGQKLNYVIIAALVAALGYFMVDKYRAPGEDEIIPVEVAETGIVKSIAVLPFTDLSPAGDQEYFGDGIAEEILNLLAKLPDLKVAGRTSSFSFKGQNVDLREIGQQLDVAYVLEGSVRQSGDQLRITAQLIRSDNGFHLWSETFERTAEDIFAIQDEIARAILLAMKLQLGAGGDATLRTERSDSLEAYSQVLQGRYLWAQRNVPGNRGLAMEAFERATLADPDYATAWADLGRVIVMSGEDGTTDLPLNEHLALGRAALDRALALDPENVSARAHTGYLKFIYEFEWQEGLRLVNEAIAAEPNNAEFYHLLASFHIVTGDKVAFRRATGRMRDLDPRNAVQMIQAAQRYLEFALFSDAQRVLDQFRRSGGAFLAYLQFYLDWLREMQTGEMDAAGVAIDEALAKNLLSEGFARLFRSFVAAKAGDKEEARRLLEDSMRGAPEELYVDDAWTFASVADQIGDIDLALQILERSRPLVTADFIPGSTFLTGLNGGFFPPSDALRRHPRYHAIWQRPVLSKIAELRRAGGHTAGLPLPVTGDGGPDE